MKRLVIYGAWYFSKVIAEAAEACGWEVLGYVDPDPPEIVDVLETLPENASFFVAIGDNAIREALTLSLIERGRDIATIVHPSAYISPSSKIGEGSFIAEMAAVRTNAILGKGVVLQAGSIVSHDCRVEAYASFGPNAASGSKVQVGKRTVVGVGGNIAPEVIIGDDCTVAAGSVVFRNSENGKTLVGNPARATPSPQKEVKQSNWGSNTLW